MRTFKYVDLSVQLFLLIMAIFYCICIDTAFIFYAYALTGTWQLVSIAVHSLYSAGYFEARDRKYYLRSLAATVLFTIVSYLAVGIPSFYILAFSLPFLFIWYAAICYSENKIIEHKRFVHMK